MKNDSGLQTIVCHGPFAATIERVCATIVAMGYHVFSRVDHAANAARVGKQLPPTVLVLFGNPAIGTDLIAERRTAGIDLPSKVLVWQDAQGTVHLTYNTASWLKERHDLGAEGTVAAEMLAAATERIGVEATGAEGPSLPGGDLPEQTRSE